MNLFKGILYFVKINLYQILSIIFASFLMFIQFIYSSDWENKYPDFIKYIVIGWFLVYIFVQLLNIKDNIDKSKLKKELNNWREEASLLLEWHIYGLSKKLNFWDDENWFINRLSVYKKDEKWFYCITRCSDSEEFNRKSKKVYLDKWVLYQIWDRWNREWKWFFDNKIPKPAWKRKQYRNYHKSNYGLTDEDLDELHMKSLLYYWYRVDIDKKPVAVILYETTKQDKFTNDDLDTTFRDHIPPLLHVLKFILPNITKPLYDNNKQI